MKRQNLINRLVNRKLTSGNKRKPICICMYRKLCFAQAAPNGMNKRQ